MLEIQQNKGFSYLHGNNATILILGTMPGVTSLKKIEYYGNPRNSFWKILSHIFNGPADFSSYDEKCKFLEHNKIGLSTFIRTV